LGEKQELAAELREAGEAMTFMPGRSSWRGRPERAGATRVGSPGSTDGQE